MMRYLLLFILFPFLASGQKYELVELTAEAASSIRGMSVVSDQIAWVSGSAGSVGKTLDGGKTWSWFKPAGYEQLDFRDIEAFDGKRAVIVNAGSPAFILTTRDGGKTWKEVYQNRDSAIFLDGMAFWNQREGLIFGDPINHKMQLLKTKDGGGSWSDVSGSLHFPLAEGEAGFAASGSTIRAMKGGKVWIATGGKVSNIYVSNNYGSSWSVYPCPIWQGESSTGVFSMDFLDKKRGIVVGGNYVKDKENANNILLTYDGGKTWKKPVSPVKGYRSSVLYINPKLVLATGTSGTDISEDGGLNWSSLSPLGFNVLGKSKNSRLILLANGKGQVYQLRRKKS
ncbi:WD40/YVTN/BNR-like repeat-containing protein [Pedobacter faecalis]|uniref:WD40/YVTN/BNR-like repeat-containing protein n=1 Tax=Pedobacter faecalis TaxID=3041495 RepID=UPI00254D4A3F|nr:YCF48-related protein [Pedobacter sp. ELA7]